MPPLSSAHVCLHAYTHTYIKKKENIYIYIHAQKVHIHKTKLYVKDFIL